MDYSRWILPLIFAGLFAVSGAVSASEVTPSPGNDGYWTQSDQGWFWYQDPPPPVQPEIPPPETPTPDTQPAPTPDKPVPLTAKWFRENLDNYRDKAIDNPSPENVKLYLYLQRLAMDKAEMYSHASQLAVMDDPALDQASLTPTNSQSKTAANAARAASMKGLMQRLAGRSGIWFFFRSDCPYCHAQAPVLSAMEHLYGFKILPISLDHKPMQDGSYPNWVPDTGQGARLGVSVTPTLYLVTPPNKVIPLGAGVMASDQMEDRIVDLGRQAGVVSDEEYASVNIYESKSYVQNGLPSDLSGIDKDPDTMLALLEAAAKRGDSTPLGSQSAGDVNWRSK